MFIIMTRHITIRCNECEYEDNFYTRNMDKLKGDGWKYVDGGQYVDGSVHTGKCKKCGHRHGTVTEVGEAT